MKTLKWSFIIIYFANNSTALLKKNGNYICPSTTIHVVTDWTHTTLPFLPESLIFLHQSEVVIIFP